MVTTEVRSADGRFNVLAAGCPTRQVIDRIGDKWTLLVLAALGERTVRFSQLRKEIEGVSQKMLTQTLRGMQRDGIVTRTVYPSVPPKVEYALTALGLGLAGVVSSIRLWAYEHMDDIEAARDEYDAAAE